MMRRFLLNLALCLAAGAAVATGPTTIPPNEVYAAPDAAPGPLAPRLLTPRDLVAPLAVQNVKCGGTDDTAAIATAVATGSPVMLNGASCVTTATIVPLSGQTIGGNGPTILHLVSGSVSRSFNLTGLNHVTIQNLTLDGTSALAGGDFFFLYGTADSSFLNLTFTNAPGNTETGSIVIASASVRNVFDNTRTSSSHGNAVIVINNIAATDNRITNCTIQSSSDAINFGIRIMSGANHNTVMGCEIIGPGGGVGSESIAVSIGSNYNKIIGNRGTLRGDNGISIVGDHNTITGNVMDNNWRAGIYLWGSDNTVSGNILLDNDQESSTHWPCIGMNGDYGGTAQNNVITGNICDDDQATPTQYGIISKAANYTGWVTGTPYTAGQYIYNGLNTYQAGSTATSGATAPTCTGYGVTCSDGTITWTYKSTYLTYIGTDYNFVFNNQIPHFSGPGPVAGFPSTTPLSYYINRNPDMLISQMNENNAQGGQASGAMIMDGWRYNAVSGGGGGSVSSFHRVAASLPGKPYSLVATSAANGTMNATTIFQMVDNIEGVDILKLAWGTAAAVPVTLDACVNLSGVTIPALVPIVLDNGFAGSAWYSYVTHVNVTAASTWQCFSVQIPGPTGGAWNVIANQKGLGLSFGLGAGANALTSTTNAWQAAGPFEGSTGDLNLFATSGAVLRIANVHLYPAGSMPVPRSYSEELAKAQHFYYKTFKQGTVPAQNAGLAGAPCVRNPIASGEPSLFVQAPQDMFAGTTPVITTYNPSAANTNWRDVTAGADITVSVDPATAIGKSGIELTTTGTVATLGDNLCIHVTINSNQ